MYGRLSLVCLALLSLLSPFEPGILELQVKDVTGKMIKNVGITCTEGCGTASNSQFGRGGGLADRKMPMSG